MNYFSFKLSDPTAIDFVSRVKKLDNNIEIIRLNWHREEIKIGDIVFVNFAGDQTPWEKGLIGISIISKEPYDLKYDKENPKNFKIQIDTKIVLDKPISREEIIPYKGLYDVAGIGPTTKGVPNQAIQKIEKAQAFLLARVLIDRQPDLEIELSQLFDADEIRRIKEPIIKLEPVSVKFGEVIELVEPIDKAKNNELSFANFLAQGKFAQRTIDNYIYSLKREVTKTEWFAAMYPLVSNLFEIFDYGRFSEISEAIKANTSFPQYCRDDHNRLTAALKQYDDYLKIKHEKRIEGGYNKIFYGAPGCGKSYLVKKQLMDMSIDEVDIIRTTFYQDYTYTDFVGQIFPVMKNSLPEYDFVPGPFTIAYKHAIEYPGRRVFLIIEELNRGNAPSIFGDLFQLLDRYKGKISSKLIGESEYPVIIPPIQDFLSKCGINVDNVALPSNLFILATMNTSDQNVFTLDTAFKRRWNFEKVYNKFTTGHEFSAWYIPGTDVTWKKFVNEINKLILEKQSRFMTSEDKQIGIFFMTKYDLVEKPDDSNEANTKAFANKVLEYVWNDIAKFNRDEWFKTNIRTLDDLIENFVEYGKLKKGLEVFEDARKFE